eukprot:UN09963
MTEDHAKLQRDLIGKKEGLSGRLGHMFGMIVSGNTIGKADLLLKLFNTAGRWPYNQLHTVDSNFHKKHSRFIRNICFTYAKYR